MNAEQIRLLIDKYLEGETSVQEEHTLRTYFREEKVPDELKPYADQFRYHQEMSDTEAPDEFDPFAKIDFEQKAKTPHLDHVRPPEGDGKRRSRRGMSTSILWSLRIAAGILLLVVGFAAGRFMGGGKNRVEYKAPAQNTQVQAMQAALMNTDDYRQPSAGKRLSAVDISKRLVGKNQTIDQQVARILTYTINNDENVNVREAAAEALFKYRHEMRIKPALVHALARQNDPLMQITLIHMLIQLKAKEAVPEMQQLLVNSETRKVVRQQLKVGIAQLQT